MKSRSKFFAGKCLCTAITVRLPEKVTDVGVCHCAMCRRWNSGPWMSFQVPEAEITGKPLAVYRSSAFAERGFCARCGSHIFHRPQDGPELAISAGLFDFRDQYIAREICFDDKPPFYEFVAESERRTTASMAREWLPRLLKRRVARWPSGS